MDAAAIASVNAYEKTITVRERSAKAASELRRGILRGGELILIRKGNTFRDIVKQPFQPVSVVGGFRGGSRELPASRGAGGHLR
jgi:hypothetical protein